MAVENWSPIQGYEGRYAVSSYGNVMSMDFARTGLPGILKFNKSRGYLAVELQTGPVKKRFTVHRLVAAAFIGPRPIGQHINHIDGNKQNNCATNLEYVTPSENQKHSFRIGLASNKGERHSQARLTEEKVREIRTRCAAGENMYALAREFSVSHATIYYVHTRKRWGHVTEKVESIQ